MTFSRRRRLVERPRPRPTLPIELIEDILAQNSISKRTLARCCLVSRQFLDPARRALYSSIKLACGPSYADVDWDTEKYIPDKATELLIKSLRLFPAIRPFVKSICCIDYDEEGAQKNYYGPDVNDLVEDLLPLLPSVNQLYIQATGLRRLDYFIFSCADRWITLEFDEIDLDGMSADTKFTNLKRLKLGYISGSDKHKYFHLPKLTHLEINQESIEPIRITDITSSQIRFLRLQVLDLFHSPNLCQLPTLKHLEIVSPAIGRNTITLRTVETLSRYHSLETLVINVTSTERNSILFKLLESLPPSITRLEFPDHVPFRPLFRYAQTDHPKSIRYIVFPKANIQKEEDFEMKVKSLKRMYRKQDIKIRYLEDKPSEFGPIAPYLPPDAVRTWYPYY